MTQKLTDEFLIEHRDRNNDQPSADLLSLRAAVRRYLLAIKSLRSKERTTAEKFNADLREKDSAENALIAEMAGIDGEGEGKANV